MLGCGIANMSRKHTEWRESWDMCTLNKVRSADNMTEPSSNHRSGCRLSAGDVPAGLASIELGKAIDKCNLWQRDQNHIHVHIHHHHHRAFKMSTKLEKSGQQWIGGLHGRAGLYKRVQWCVYCILPISTVMIYFPIVALAMLVPAVVGAPLERRIAQIISDSTTQWEQACVCGILRFIHQPDHALIANTVILKFLGCCRWWRSM
jgi:hypothetical protein